MKIFSVYDSKAQAWHQPIFCPNNAVAMRAFQDAAQQQGGQIAAHAADYTLFQIGDWDEATGKLNGIESKIGLGSALDYLTPIENVTPIERKTS